jgi:hypothetical protein
MLRQDQKIKLIEALNEELTKLNGIDSVILFPEEIVEKEFVEVITHEFCNKDNLLQVYHTLNLSNLIATDYQLSVEFERDDTDMCDYKNIYYFKFI